MTCSKSCWEKRLTLADRRAAVQFLIAGGLSVRRACALVQIHRSTVQYAAHATDDTPLLNQIQHLAVQHPRYGYRRITVLVNRTQRVNQKRIRRLWRRQRLQARRVVRKRTRRARPERVQAAPPPTLGWLPATPRFPLLPAANARASQYVTRSLRAATGRTPAA